MSSAPTDIRGALKDAQDSVSKLQGRRQLRRQLAMAAVKAVFVVGASLVAGIAQFAALQPGDALSAWGRVGIVASFILGLGGLVLIVVDWRDPEELETAERSTSLANFLYDFARDAAKLGKQLETATELYRAMIQMALSVQLLNQLDVEAEVDRVELMFLSAEDTLLLAFDFEVTEQWSVSIYRTEQLPADGRILRCAISRRSERLKPRRRGRDWPFGVGVAGIAAARGTELILPDLTDKALGNFDELPANLAKPTDATRYRSVAAVPVIADDDVWGVVVATSDRPSRFDLSDARGVRSAEGVRALAQMLAVAVTSRHKPPSLGNEGGGTSVSS